MRKAEHEWFHEKEKNHLFFTIYPDVTLFLNRISGCAIFELLHGLLRLWILTSVRGDLSFPHSHARWSDDLFLCCSKRRYIKDESLFGIYNISMQNVLIFQEKDAITYRNDSFLAKNRAQNHKVIKYSKYLHI